MFFTKTAAERKDEDTYIGFVIRCRLTHADVVKAFALSTTFTEEQQSYILEFLQEHWK